MGLRTVLIWGMDERDCGKGSIRQLGSKKGTLVGQAGQNGKPAWEMRSGLRHDAGALSKGVSLCYGPV